MDMMTYATIFLITAVPAILMLLGSLIAVYKTPSQKLTSAIQHFAAGIVFAAVAVELIPILLSHMVRLDIAIGFILGIIIMLIIDHFNHKLEKVNAKEKQLPLGLILAVAIDLFIDGMLVGVSYLANQRSGIIIALALSLETLFLGVTVIIDMQKQYISPVKSVSIIFAMAILIMIGAVLGYGIVSQLSSYWQMGIIAFGVTALLYLVVEELLVKAHKLHDTKFATAMFFIGFLIVLLIS
ncbi:hypothetical protein L3V82_12300 [Thiotrichales bacterium 19S3-7]|nr:hypothetical protein [Thiotrichales bacterium 19S3-7]MCF6802971.1 hypothetical protein [Thiotrichales bacterium 19S3-11]